MIKRLILLFFAFAVLAGCDAFSSEPTYRGISVAGMNYTPFNLTRFVIRDKYGNTASGGGDHMPGAGEGSLSCCYALKGTDFTVDWEIYDQDEFIKNPYAPIKKIRKTTQVHFPKTKISGGAGEVVLAVHFYPDYHVEFEFRNDLSGSRIAYDDVWDWLRKQHKQLINPNNDDDSVVFRRVAKLASQGWLKHGFTSTADLQQYCYFYLLDPSFDQRSEVEQILRESKGRPGVFGEAMQKLPEAVLQEIKSNHFRDAMAGATQ
ncbi:hypothetical protein [Burkholderia cenocepacia]|uniref:hypothetical protein n=1 Tax=Burkholderia cenocepacia TaxID=95486 RepID=UPI001BA0B4B4|nr:hypothetical protein [Burkholderia cenocepacia]MBR7943617.1 hypothetical protein [Burkholderia cenocepacia]